MSYTHKRMGYSQKNTKEFEPQLGNLYRLEKPNSKITKVIHRRAARVVNQTIDNGPVTINTPMNITDSQQLRSISTINRWESDTDNYIMMDHVQPIKENRNTECLKKHHYRTIQDGNAILNNRVVKENNLDLNLHKVKGHSGNLWNDKVDELAKQASSSTSASNIVQFNQGHDGLNFVPMINEVPVEQKLRKFVKNVMNFVNDGQWSQLSCNQDALLDRTKDYDWDITWNALKQVKHFKCTSSKHNKLWALWAFWFKLLNNLLPIDKTLKLRHPNLYKNFICPMYNLVDEMISHITSCTGSPTTEAKEKFIQIFANPCLIY
ncbi:hypothetical protein GLOIN_2v1788498 [Rhizophagus irregularis DAOM 181602=DAOM 197198]|nr:hypothetical protein GLOIN_2v1788498 [Rhizophagus irregularis DAOM 181602=DAOM 197198]